MCGNTQMFSNSWYLVKGGSCKQDIPVGMELCICLKKQCPVSATFTQCKQGNIAGEIRKRIHCRKSQGHEWRPDQLRSDKRCLANIAACPVKCLTFSWKSHTQVH